jgi:hypothetical protein
MWTRLSIRSHLRSDRWARCRMSRSFPQCNQRQSSGLGFLGIGYSDRPTVLRSAKYSDLRCGWRCRQEQCRNQREFPHLLLLTPGPLVNTHEHNMQMASAVSWMQVRITPGKHGPSGFRELAATQPSPFVAVQRLLKNLNAALRYLETRGGESSLVVKCQMRRDLCSDARAATPTVLELRMGIAL